MFVSKIFVYIRKVGIYIFVPTVPYLKVYIYSH